MNLHIELAGRGPLPLVLIHGWAMHGGVFAPLVEALAERCTLHLVDLPGHGHSRDCALPLEPAICAQAIIERTPPAAWLGWSLGGLIALTAALEHADHVRALAMLCATPRFLRDADWPGGDPELLHRLAQDLHDDYRATLERFLALEAMGSDDAAAELRRLRALVFARGEPDPRVLEEGIGLLERSDLRAALPRLATPSLWIAGHRDRLVPPAAMRRAAQISHGRFIEIAHAGHAPFIGHAERVAAALLPLVEAAAA
jgi:pimeloyl-[acyl-carrier protein] methyl ester esterase